MVEAIAGIAQGIVVSTIAFGIFAVPVCVASLVYARRQRRSDLNEAVYTPRHLKQAE